MINLAVSLKFRGFRDTFSHVMMEPSGDAFNSILKLDTRSNLPFNPMINAGAIQTVSLLAEEFSFEELLQFARELCMDPDICLDEAQFKVIKEKVLRKDIFQLEFDIRNHFYRGPVKYHNIIGIIRGSKYPNEYVLTGGHLDSYDNGTGAVDDGNGTSLNMEVARLLATSGAKPKRSIMICIWTGEEYGLLGSKFFVENKTVPLEKISNYINRDGGPLMSTGVSVPPAMYDDYVEICKPIMDLDPEVPFTVNKRPGELRPRPTSAGGSDHAYFAMNGVPTIGFQESDPKGYNFEYQEIWHTERDIYNKVIPEYMEHSATVTAVVVYGLANLDHQLFRQGLYKE